jgi:pimeloyl-ACP methyl ester carboxylesterase
MLAPLQMSVPATDGIVLRGTFAYPAGAPRSPLPLAVLAHQYPSTRDSFAPLVADLQAAGVATLAFDLRGHGDSIHAPNGPRVIRTPAEPTMDAFGAAFMGSATELGFAHVADDIVRVASWGLAQNFVDASRVLLVGASIGGTGVLLAAPRLGSAVRGVLTFGAAGAPAHGPDAMRRIRETCESLRVPMLFATSEQDPFDAHNNGASWSRGLKHAGTRVVPGAAHGMAIYFEVRADVMRFVKSALAAPGRRPGAVRPARRSRTRG